MISALGWIRRESAAVKPTKYQLSESDYSAFLSQANEQIIKTREEAEKAGIDLDTAMKDSKSKRDAKVDSDIEMGAEKEELSKEETEELAKYNLDEYDDENQQQNEKSSSDGSDFEDDEMMLDEEEGNGIFMPLSKLVKPENSSSNTPEEFDEEELDDLTLRPSDLLFVAAKTEDEISQLEIYVYEEQAIGESGGIEDNLYVHHDLMLPFFPLCLEWIDFPFEDKNGEKGNFVAVGSFEKQIEIWNLDVLDLVYPTVTLNGHDDAVMSLSWNRQGRNFLASGSADNSVLLWDLTRPQEALRSFNHHKDKVQTISWNPVKATELLSVAYDGIIRLFDVRAPQDGLNFVSKLKGDVEQAKWRPQGNAFAITDESGRVSFYDPRNSLEPLAILDAHSKSTTCIDFCGVDVNGNSLFLTASADKSLKVWSIDPSSTKFNCLLSREMGVGKIFTAGFLPDAPLIIGAAGNRGNVNMWNLKKEDVIKSYFTQ
jgi:periodic tryptophan protein 1